MDAFGMDLISNTWLLFSSWWGIACWVIVGLMALSRLNSPLQYSIKMFLFNFTILVLATILLPVGLLMPFRPENHRYLTYLIPFFSKFILNFDVEVRGRENVKSDKPFVLLLNHQSSLDAFVMMHIWPDRCVTIMKNELKWIFPFGPTAWLFGCIFVDRTNRTKAHGALKHAANELVKRNVKICMFPEGTRNRDGKLLSFRKGAFNLAVDAQVPLVPAVITNYSNFYSKKDNKFVPGKAILTVLAPVKTEGLTSEDVTRVSESTRDLMVEAYERSSAELLQSHHKTQ